MQKHNIGQLNDLFNDGEAADQKMFEEMRSNIRMQASEHFSKLKDKLQERLTSERSSEALKLRLVKNHLQVITKTYINGIVSQSPGVHIEPFNPDELQDVKDSQLSDSVWKAAEDRLEIGEKIERWAESFVIVGECAAIVRWNPSKGKLKHFKQATNEAGEPLYTHPSLGETNSPVDEMGQPLQPARGAPVYTGDLTIEPLHPFNIIRKKGVETMAESPFLCVRQMMPVEELKSLVNQIESKQEREEKLGYIQESAKNTFKVFDSTSGEYTDSDGQVLVREFYFRPCAEYPNGYYYITTSAGILFEGELPYGIFPIITEGFDNLPTSPRAASIIRPLRGPQSQINLLASMKGEAIITLGRDMVITQVGSKLSKGSNFAGVREFQVNGPPPTVIQGRDGSQFEAALAREVEELYRLANLEYEMAENSVQDPYQQLFRSLSQSKKYQIYAKKFERFLCRVAKLYLRLAKRYLPDDYVIRAIGKREAINIAEFRRIDDEGFNIKTKPMSTDIQSMFGKLLNIRDIMQYAGDIPPNAKARIIKQMPFIDKEDLGFLTADDDCVDSDILALDRGEYRPAQHTDKHELYIERLNHRMKLSDFRMLPPQVQQMYQAKMQEHTQLQAEQMQQQKALEADMIPTSGALVTCSIQVPDPEKPGATKQLRLPYDALMSLVQRLEAQGSSMAGMQNMDLQNQLQIMQAGSALSQQQQQQQPMDPSQPQADGMPPAPNGLMQ